MADEGFKRKLTAILSADVEGYSRLMDDDEAATVRTLTAYRSAITELVQKFSGRVVDSPGDNILAEFTSVVDAVSCAAKIQRDLAERNAELPDERKMQFRIGVNLGDVIDEEERIYGDGVNIAARIESLSDAGGICISHSAYDQIKNKLKFGYEYLGEHEVKNIREPVKAYRVLMEPEFEGKFIGFDKTASKKGWIWAATAAVVIAAVGLGIWQFYIRRPVIEAASEENMAYPLPDKPSIAVLPFENLSGDPKQDYFSDGLAEQISSTLSRFRSLFVISSSSTSTYKGKSVKIQKIAEDLGVKYVLEGSVQRSADRIRITAQLIDATTGHQIWSERYDREQKDIFAIQDDITLEITKALQADIMSGEQARHWAKNQTRNLEAWEKWLKGDEYYFRFTKEDNATARRLFEEAIVLDPEYAFAYVMLGWTYFLDARFGWVDSRAESFKMAGKYAQKGMELNDSLDNSYLLMGSVYFNQGQHEKAIAKVEQAIALNPNGANNYYGLAAMVGLLGRWNESIQLTKKSMRLRPNAPAHFYQSLGRAYFMTGQYDEAIATLKKILNPNYLPAYAFLAACYSSLNLHADAAAAADEVRRINPKFDLESYAKTLPYKNKADKERYIAALRKAGLPEKPPLPDKPSIAVLPFVNMSDDPAQEYFSDGMTDDIITDLSKISGLMVISSSSTFTYKGRAIKIPEIAKELGVKYVLEGSVRRAGDEIRINAQLIDAETDHHMWADRFDGKNENIFALQDMITERIVSALSVKLSDPEKKEITEMGTNNLLAYEEYLKGITHMRKFTPKDYAIAIEHFNKAIEIDQNYSQVFATLADLYVKALQGGKRFWDEIGKDYFKARILARYYLELSMKKPTSSSFQVLAYLELFKRNFSKAIDYAEHAVALSPNNADALERLAYIMVANDRPKEAIKYYKKSIMLDPLNKSTGGLGRAYFIMGDYEQAVKYFEKHLKDYPETFGIRGLLAISYAFLGNDIKAKKAFKEFYT